MYIFDVANYESNTKVKKLINIINPIWRASTIWIFIDYLICMF